MRTALALIVPGGLIVLALWGLYRLLRGRCPDTLWFQPHDPMMRGWRDLRGRRVDGLDWECRRCGRTVGHTEGAPNATAAQGVAA
jgi:hypothetical protein